MAQTPAGRHAHPRHDWTSVAYAEDWLRRDAPRAERHRALFALMCHLLPFAPEDRFRFVDIGTGNGALAALVLQTFPHSTAVCLDLSPTMLGHAGESLSRFEGRVSFVQADLAQPGWTTVLRDRQPDAAVSSRAVHNLFDRRGIQRVYRELCELLPAGGIFVDADYAGPSPALAERFRNAAAALAAAGSADTQTCHEHGRDHPSSHDHGQAHDGQEHSGTHWAGTLEDHLRWLRRAGFRAVDCPWREIYLTVFVAQK